MLITSPGTQLTKFGTKGLIYTYLDFFLLFCSFQCVEYFIRKWDKNSSSLIVVNWFFYTNIKGTFVQIFVFAVKM